MSPVDEVGEFLTIMEPQWKTSLILNVKEAADLEAVRLLVEAGIGVVAHFRCNSAQMNRLVEQLWDGGGRIVALRQEAEGRAAQARLLHRAERALGPIDLVLDLSDGWLRPIIDCTGLTS